MQLFSVQAHRNNENATPTLPLSDMTFPFPT